MSKVSNRTRIFEWMVDHSKLTFLLMSFSFVAFGVLSLNLISYIAANANYLLTYQWMAFIDGGAQQLLEIWLTTFLALAFYLIFKLCEHALIERIAHQAHQAVAPPPAMEVVQSEFTSPLH